MDRKYENINEIIVTLNKCDFDRFLTKKNPKKSTLRELGTLASPGDFSQTYSLLEFLVIKRFQKPHKNYMQSVVIDFYSLNHEFYANCKITRIISRYIFPDFKSTQLQFRNTSFTGKCGTMFGFTKY